MSDQFENDNMEIVECFSDKSPKFARILEEQKLIQEIRWHENGNLFEKIQYKNGEKEGASLQWFDNGSLKWERHFSKGQLHGPEKIFNTEGQLIQQNFWNHNHQEGTQQEWFSNGQLKAIYEYSEDTAQVKTYYDNGDPESEFTLIDGTKQGPGKTWTRNGKFKPCQWIDGELHGTRRSDQIFKPR